MFLGKGKNKKRNKNRKNKINKKDVKLIFEKIKDKKILNDIQNAKEIKGQCLIENNAKMNCLFKCLENIDNTINIKKNIRIKRRED